MVVTRTKLPANYRVPAHTHPMAETVTVISGSVGFGMGEKFDDKKGEMVKTGGFFAQAAKHAHYVWTGNEEAVIQVQYVGPGGIDYINRRTIFARSRKRRERRAPNSLTRRHERPPDYNPGLAPGRGVTEDFHSTIVPAGKSFASAARRSSKLEFIKY
jgi:hypothetical protein